MKESEKILLSGYHIKHIFDELNKTKYKSFKYNTLSAKLHYMKTLHNLKFSENKNMEWPKKKRIIYTVFGISSIVTIFGCFIMGISVPAGFLVFFIGMMGLAGAATKRQIPVGGDLLSEENDTLPCIRFNDDKCKFTLISMNNSKVKEEDGQLKKDKSSERNTSGVPAEETTHFSDPANKIVWTKYNDYSSNRVWHDFTRI